MGDLWLPHALKKVALNTSMVLYQHTVQLYFQEFLDTFENFMCTWLYSEWKGLKTMVRGKKTFVPHLSLVISWPLVSTLWVTPVLKTTSDNSALFS